MKCVMTKDAIIDATGKKIVGSYYGMKPNLAKIEKEIKNDE